MKEFKPNMMKKELQRVESSGKAFASAEKKAWFGLSVLCQTRKIGGGVRAAVVIGGLGLYGATHSLSTMSMEVIELLSSTALLVSKTRSKLDLGFSPERARGTTKRS
ncbi:PREDICTED: uncharacterized protein LOC104760951 isoform X2 [Camelina sativa]|uniref:Uncharacterized protein LOC104760951 isoform X2 n=1 Tax=Camelina sativa TaxID=90675 RepID=A0ABM0X8G2_CAMSA|nr:PREDICTED: uncharacterized protein LOC104760951 isoform X2 [Camelina sativa]